MTQVQMINACALQSNLYQVYLRPVYLSSTNFVLTERFQIAARGL